ncbi:isocyanide synthase family protein [bacterium]|nr:isocyanide synthase family protein [bacterium]
MIADQATSHSHLTTEVLDLVLQYRRSPAETESCANSRCEECASQHADRIAHAIEQREPIIFVLPAFPGKSPNPAKVLGPHADMAERQSLAFLDSLCQRIGRIYAPGAKIVLCSDGRVFNDVVGITEENITLYQQDLLTILEELESDALIPFNLDNAFAGSSYGQMRARLMEGYSEALETIQASVRAGGDAHRLYCGLTRFLLEDATRPGMALSRTALQKECRRRAYEVIQRSQAWDRLLAEYFPRAVRLSIHPQVCGSRKIGIHLMDTQDAWLTAWHSVAVEIDGRFRLMKRAEAESLGAALIYQEGRPSHYKLEVRHGDAL